MRILSNLKYWVWLAENTGLSAVKRAMLIEALGSPERAAAADRGVLESLGWLGKYEIDAIMRRNFSAAERIIEKCERSAISIMTMQDAAYPESLRNIPDPPAVLYYKGRMPDFDSLLPISVVGMRRCTPHGCKTAEKFAGDLSAGGAYIISGLARGIDSSAHLGAIKAGYGTSAVLGCGCDVVYPPENGDLYDAVCGVGALISEYPPGTPPNASNFPRRNRIMSGLAKGVLVVEAAERSGSLITARLALEQGRDVFAVPGAPDAPEHLGTNMLIRDGAAKLAANAQDILCEYDLLFRQGDVRPSGQPDAAYRIVTKTAKNAAREPVKVDAEKIKGFTERQLDIILSIAEGPKTAEELTEELAVEAREVLTELTMLQLEGAVEQNSSGFYAPVREYFNA